MIAPRLFVLRDIDLKRRCADFIVREAPLGHEVVIAEPRMTDSKKRRFHAVCGELARARLIWGGRARSRGEWKVLLISAHATATGIGVEVIEGLEGELVNVREQISTMSRGRGNSLIQYSEAFAIRNGVQLKDLSHYED